MGWVIELLLLEPAQIAHCPALLPRLDATVLEHEGAHLLTMNAQHFDRCGSGPDEIAHRTRGLRQGPKPPSARRREAASPRRPNPDGSSSPDRPAFAESTKAPPPCTCDLGACPSSGGIFGTNSDSL